MQWLARCRFSTPQNVVALFRDNERAGTKIDSKTIKSRWLGERMDYDIGIYALWWRDHEDES